MGHQLFPFPAPHHDPLPVPPPVTPLCYTPSPCYPLCYPLCYPFLPFPFPPCPCPCPSPSGALIATWREKGCTSFWRVLRQFPLLRSHVQCWKACFVIHRSFRDGHPDVSEKQTLTSHTHVCSFYRHPVSSKRFTHCISAFKFRRYTKHDVSTCVCMALFTDWEEDIWESECGTVALHAASKVIFASVCSQVVKKSVGHVRFLADVSKHWVSCP